MRRSGFCTAKIRTERQIESSQFCQTGEAAIRKTLATEFMFGRLLIKLVVAIDLFV